jgi:hypothetical protein
MFRLKLLIAVAAAMLAAQLSHAAVSFTEDFSSDPFAPAGNWSFGIGDNSNSQFTWNSAAPAAYTGDAVGSLGVHFDSSLPTARFQRSLGVTVSDADDFALTARFRFNVTTAGTEDFMQIAFGLVNSALTGGNRTGTTPSFGDADTFHTVEFDYFPNVTAFGGPTLTPTVFGAQSGGSDIFGNFASIFGPDSDLGDNGAGFITALPENIVLEAALNYDGTAKTLTLTMSQVNPDGSLTLLNTGVPALSLAFGGTPFSVDSLAIMAYFDAADFDPSTLSLEADATIERFEFFTPVPEPSTMALVCFGVAAALLGGGSRRCRS